MPVIGNQSKNLSSCAQVLGDVAKNRFYQIVRSSGAEEKQRVVKGQMRNLKLGLLGLKQKMFLRHFPVYQGIEENYLYLEIKSVVEIKIANNPEI